jgi:hypothetical protein
MNYRVSYEGHDLGTLRSEDGQTLVAVADEYHRTLLEEVSSRFAAATTTDGTCRNSTPRFGRSS